jgi:predicted DCC family thiol-disulfide oxidoreductase YuxK
LSQIIFFDGVCVLCNGFVDFVLSRDSERIFKFAPLQGETAKRTLPEHFTKDMSTVVLWSQGQIFQRSDAALMILVQLGGIYSLARIFWILPQALRDLCYRLVASQRYHWFGKKDSCRLPTQEERAMFLD